MQTTFKPSIQYVALESVASLTRQAIDENYQAQQIYAPTQDTTMFNYNEQILSTTSATTSMDEKILLEQQEAVSRSAMYTSVEELTNYFVLTHWTAFVHAFLASFSVILVSELGDKTFIITAIMAMKNSRALVFIASAMALLCMTVLSVGMGVAVTVVPRIYTHYISTILFFCFGFRMLFEAYQIKSDGEDECGFDEVKRSLESNNNEGHKKVPLDAQLVPEREPDEIAETKIQIDQTDESPSWFKQLIKTLYVAPLVINVFTMIFVAEWGDRSQISTVILAARENTSGVFLGSLFGHVFCTGLAVIGGRFVADTISVKTMTIIGGLIFLFFAAFAIISGPQ